MRVSSIRLAVGAITLPVQEPIEVIDTKTGAVPRSEEEEVSTGVEGDMEIMTRA